MTALAPYLAQNLGHPLVTQGIGADYVDPEVAEEAEALMGIGFRPAAAFRRAMGNVRQRRMARMQQRCQQFPQPRPYMGQPQIGADDLAMYGDDDDDDFDDYIGALDEEIDELDDDSDLGAEDDEFQVGANISQLETKIAKMQAKREQLRAKVENLSGPFKKLRAKKIRKRIERLTRKIARKMAKLDQKRSKLAAKLGVPPAAVGVGTGVAAGAAAGAGITAAALASSGVNTQKAIAVERAMGRMQGNAPFGQGRWPTLPPEGELVPVPILFSGSNVLGISVAAGSGLRTSSITGVSQSISYATFEVLGIQCELNVTQGLSAGGFPLGEILINCLLDTLVVAGGVDALYGSVSITQSANVTSLGGSGFRFSHLHRGLRDNGILDRTSTAELTGTFRQEITNTEDIEATFQASLLCRALTDPNARAIGG